MWWGNNSCLPTGPLLCCRCQRKSAAERGCTIAGVVPARALGSVKLGQWAGLGMARGYRYTSARQPEPGHAAPGCYYFAVSIGGLIRAEIHPPLLASPACCIDLGSLGQCGMWPYKQQCGCCMGHKQEEGELAYTTLLLFFKLDSV